MSDPRRELKEITASLRAAVEQEAARGTRATEIQDPQAGRVVRISAPSQANPALVAAGDADTAPKSPAKAPPSTRGKKLDVIPVPPSPPDFASRMKALNVLAGQAASCEKCGLCATRKQVVFSSGTAKIPVMFIGEAPGAEEDKQGRPFVGRAGKLLDQIIDAVGFDRSEIYVANILKCRPPQNRDPLPPEIEACTPYLEKQIDLVKPKIICALGKFSAQFLSGQPKATMGALRGNLYVYRDIPVLPIYHPAALLRNPNLKRIVWEDVQILRREYLA